MRRNVRYWHLADIELEPGNVRFWGQSGHRPPVSKTPVLNPKRK
jgi:hypothetical protein